MLLIRTYISNYRARALYDSRSACIGVFGNDTTLERWGK